MVLNSKENIITVHFNLQSSINVLKMYIFLEYFVLEMLLKYL